MYCSLIVLYVPLISEVNSISKLFVPGLLPKIRSCFAENGKRSHTYTHRERERERCYLQTVFTQQVLKNKGHGVVLNEVNQLLLDVSCGVPGVTHGTQPHTPEDNTVWLLITFIQMQYLLTTILC